MGKLWEIVMIAALCAVATLGLLTMLALIGVVVG